MLGRLLKDKLQLIFTHGPVNLGRGGILFLTRPLSCAPSDEGVLKSHLREPDLLLRAPEFVHLALHFSTGCSKGKAGIIH